MLLVFRAIESSLLHNLPLLLIGIFVREYGSWALRLPPVLMQQSRTLFTNLSMKRL